MALACSSDRFVPTSENLRFGRARNSGASVQER